MGGGQSSRLWHKGGTVSIFFLSALRASFRSKNKGGRGNGPSPGSATADGVYELPEMSFELAFNLVGKLTIAFLTGQSWPDQSRPVVIVRTVLRIRAQGRDDLFGQYFPKKSIIHIYSCGSYGDIFGSMTRRSERLEETKLMSLVEDWFSPFYSP